MVEVPSPLHVFAPDEVMTRLIVYRAADGVLAAAGMLTACAPVGGALFTAGAAYLLTLRCSLYLTEL